MGRQSGPLEIEIAWNNAGVADVCGNCGMPINPYIGYEPFIAGTKTIVCDNCANDGVITGHIPEGFALFDQSAVAAEIEEMERRGEMPRSEPRAPAPVDETDDVPF